MVKSGMDDAEIFAFLEQKVLKCSGCGASLDGNEEVCSKCRSHDEAALRLERIRAKHAEHQASSGRSTESATSTSTSSDRSSSSVQGSAQSRGFSFDATAFEKKRAASAAAAVLRRRDLPASTSQVGSSISRYIGALKHLRPGHTVVPDSSQAGAGPLSQSLKPKLPQSNKASDETTIDLPEPMMQFMCDTRGDPKFNERHWVWREKGIRIKCLLNETLGDALNRVRLETLEEWREANPLIAVPHVEISERDWRARHRNGQLKKAWMDLTMEEFIQMLIKNDDAKEYLEPKTRSSKPHEVVGGEYLRKMNIIVDIQTGDYPYNKMEDDDDEIYTERRSKRQRTKAELAEDYVDPSTSEIDEMDDNGSRSMGSVAASQLPDPPSRSTSLDPAYNRLQSQTPSDLSRTPDFFSPTFPLPQTTPPSINQEPPYGHVGRLCKVTLIKMRPRRAEFGRKKERDRDFDCDDYEDVEYGTRRFFVPFESSVGTSEVYPVLSEHGMLAFKCKTGAGSQNPPEIETRESNMDYVAEKCRDLARLDHYIGLSAIPVGMLEAAKVFSIQRFDEATVRVPHEGGKGSSTVIDMYWSATSYLPGRVFSYQDVFANPPPEIFDPQVSRIGDSFNAICHYLGREWGTWIVNIEGGFQGTVFHVFNVTFLSTFPGDDFDDRLDAFKRQHVCSAMCHSAGYRELLDKEGVPFSKKSEAAEDAEEAEEKNEVEEEKEERGDEQRPEVEADKGADHLEIGEGGEKNAAGVEGK